ncbi:MAG: hypothetical protein H6625_09070 [Bdellovibrionaceae bacterium]|nr:hypothetical protein [Pseudobdellovibrionaceae bacterium]
MKPKSQMLILLVDADNVRKNNLSAKMKPFGFQVKHCHSIEKSLEFQKKNPAQLIIVEQTLLDAFSGNYRRKIKDLGGDNVVVFMISTHDMESTRDYFAKGVEGIFENNLDARTMMMAVRKSKLPQDLQWQVTQSLTPVEKLSFISNSLQSLQNHKKISFGSGGFCTKFLEELKLGDRIEYSFYFVDQGQAYVIHGLSVLRWFDAKTYWGGVEFESMSGLGTPIFIQWLSQQDFSEFIPTAV